MVVIKKRSNIIPVEFDEFTLEFIYSDENLRKLKDLDNQIKVLQTQLSNEDDIDKTLNDLSKMAKLSFDNLFNEGAFDKVYAFANQSVVLTMRYLFEVVNGLANEINAQFDTDVLSKYLD